MKEESKTTKFKKLTMLLWLPMIVPLCALVYSFRWAAMVVDSFWGNFFHD